MIYEGTISYTKIDKNGNDKICKELFIVDNVGMFTDVEDLLYEKFEGLTDLDVIAIKRSKIYEITCNKREKAEEKVFVADITSSFIDEETGEEKCNVYKIALYAANFDEARNRATRYIKQGYDMSLTGLKQTKFTDII